MVRFAIATSAFACVLGLSSCNQPRSEPEAGADVSSSASSNQNVEGTRELHPPTSEGDEHVAPAATGAGKAGTDAGPVEQAYLPAESRLLWDEGGVSLPAIEDALGSASFQELVLEFERDQGADTETQDITGLYGAEIRRQLPENARLTAFSCGTSLCIGSVHTSGGNASFADWEETFAESAVAPSYTYTSIALDRGQDKHENRFVFSTDPGANAIVDSVGNAAAQSE